MKKQFCLADYGAAFATRAKGAEIGSKMVDAIVSLNDDDTLLINFKGVEALSYSFVDELFLQVLQVSQQKENIRKCIALAGWSGELINVLDQTLHRRNCSLIPSVNTPIAEMGTRILKCPAVAA